MVEKIKALITGANGMLGMELKRALQTDGRFDIVLTDIKPIVEDESFESHILDITNFKEVRNLLKKVDPDILINCAAWTDVDGAETNLWGARQINEVGSHVLALACERNFVHLIGISTDYVFGKHKVPIAFPLVPTHPPSPSSIYGTTKLNGEKAQLENYPESTIIRTSGLHSSFGKNFVKIIAEKVINGDELRVISDQNTIPTSAKHLAEFITTLAYKITVKGNVPGILHYVNGGKTDWFTTAKFISKFLTGDDSKIKEIKTEDVSQKAERPKWSILDCEDTKLKINVKIPFWTDAIENTLSELYPDIYQKRKSENDHKNLEWVNADHKCPYNKLT